MIWFFSDPHLNHANCIAHDNRPFWLLGEHKNPKWPIGRIPDVKAHDDFVVDLINRTARPQDEVWCLGDLFFPAGTPPALRQSAEYFLKRIHCKMHMVAGNHDDQGRRCAVHCKSLFASYQDLAYIKRHGVKLFLFHYPCRSWRGSNAGSIHLHGHCHGALPPLGKSLDVGLHNNGYKLLEFGEIIERTKNMPVVKQHPNMGDEE